MKNIYVLLFLTVLFACNRPQNETISNFPKTIELKGKTINTEPFKAMDITGIIDSIIIVNTGLSSYKFYLFNKNDFSLIAKTGKTGKGPKELTSATIGNIDQKKNCFYCLDRSKLKVFRFNLKAALNNKDYLPEIYTKLPEKYSHTSKINVVNDSTIIASGMLDYNLYVINKNGSVSKKIGKLPNKPNNIKAVDHSNYYRNLTTYNHHLKKLATAYNRFDTIKAYTITGNKLFQKVGPDFIKTNYKDLYRGSNKTAYWKMHSDNKYIYALYSGKKRYEMPSDANSLNNIKLFHPKTLHIFDWEGNPKLKINLDKSIVDFAIDKETNRLIGLSFEYESFVVYDFKKIKDALNN
mgnify:CR=1 FL=1